MTKSKKANGLFLLMTVGIICFNLFGRTVTAELPVGLRLISSEIVYLIPVLLCLLVGRDSPGKLIPHKAPRLSTLLMTVLFVLLLEPLVTCLNAFTMLFSPNYVLETQNELTSVSLPLQLLCIAVVPALAEEFMFRGVFEGYYREKGILPAALLSGLVFGLFHLNFNQFGYAFVIGIAFALLLEGTGSIFYGMAAHFLINGFSVIITALSDQILPLTGQESMEAAAESITAEVMVNTFCVYAVLAAVTTCLAGAVYIWIVKHSGRTAYLEENWKKPGEKKLSPVFLLGVILCAGFMVWRDFMR